MTKKSIILTSLFLISIFYFLFSILHFQFPSSAYAVDFANGWMEDNPQPPLPPFGQPNPLDKCADPNYRQQDPVGCASEKSGGGGEPGVGYLFYCAKPGNPTGIDPWHICVDSDVPSDWPSDPPGGVCYGGYPYDKRDGCTYMVDPCQAEFFGDTSGLCRGESWEALVSGCELKREGENEWCEPFPGSNCIRCEYVPRKCYERGRL